ncbi:hypothetical protein B0H21DRAFT_780274 [Amylocystis lapponica]|nr:hypothetical protein B0H21DRAFT_780274 [Amylocystis lapponica]
MFYSWPHFVPHASNIAVGLPPKHVLNCISPSYTRKPTAPPVQWVDPDPRTQAEKARRLAKYVFPRQFGLSSPFAISKGPQLQAFKLPDYTDREEEIKKKGPCKTPKRLKPVLKTLDKLIWMHGKCGYKALLEMACPSKLKTVSEKPLDNSVILVRRIR